MLLIVSESILSIHATASVASIILRRSLGLVRGFVSLECMWCNYPVSFVASILHIMKIDVRAFLVGIATFPLFYLISKRYEAILITWKFAKFMSGKVLAYCR